MQAKQLNQGYWLLRLVFGACPCTPEAWACCVPTDAQGVRLSAGSQTRPATGDHRKSST
jgi:hypothetical protein